MAVINQAKVTSKISSETGEKVEVVNNSNIQRTNKMDTDILLVKTSEKSWVLPEGTIKVTTTITNNTDQNIENITILDTLSEGASFVDGSVKVGSAEYKDLNPITGFTLPVTLGAQGADMDINYLIKIDKYLNVDTIKNSTNMTIELDSKTFSLNSNELEINILNNLVSVLKQADSLAVKTGDELTYTITISNSGTFTNTDVFFQDSIPEGTTFIENSVTIDSAQQDGLNPETGFNLNDLAPNQTITVAFKVKIN